MNIFSRIFGTDAAISSIVNSATKGLDALVYTDEEKAQSASHDRAEARKMVVEWMRSTQGQNLSRRFLAMMITGTWIIQYLSATIISLIAVWVENPDKLLASAELISESSERMNGAVMLILAFYFAAPHMDKIVGPALERFGKTGKSNTER